MADAALSQAQELELAEDLSSAETLAIPEPVVTKGASILDLTHAVDLKALNKKSLKEIEAASGGGNKFKKIIGLMGVSGGVGTTTLAIQMAYDIIRQGGKKPPSVALIDLDFGRGDCAAYLDVKAQLNHEDLIQNPERIDIPLAAAYIARHKSGIHVLGTKNKLGGNDNVKPDTVLALLDVVCDMFDVIILDIPRIWRPWNQAAIGAADHFSLITELSIPGIHKTRQQMHAIEDAVDDMTGKTEIIINKMERRTFKNDIKIQDAVKILNRPLTGAVCIDGDATLSALNRGIPTGIIRPDGRYAKDTRNILNFWKKDEQNFATHTVK